MKEVTRLLNAARRRIVVPCLYDRPPDPRHTVFLAGTARSGTTWVSEILNYRNEYRYIFEPFNPSRVPLVAPVGIRRYLRPDDAADDVLPIAERVLSGRLRSSWTERFNGRLVADKRLIKDIRANLMLKWLHDRFPSMPIILLMRHPCAVVHSYRKQGWRGAVEPLLAQPRLVEDFLSPCLEEIRAAPTAFERAAYIWCVETLVPLNQFEPGEVHLVFYEHLVADPAREIERMFAFLGKHYDPEILAKVTRPSLTSRKGSVGSTGGTRLEGWRREMDAAETRRIFEIVGRFGLDAIYSEAPMPDLAGLEALKGWRSGFAERGARDGADPRFTRRSDDSRS
jgi:hypothetical protein